MKKEIHIFLTAILFFTRIPVSKNIPYSSVNLAKSIRYFSLVGLIVGCLNAFVYYISEFLFNHSISILLSMVSSVLLTGAFHEDGFADVCDGFGGGYTKEKIMQIMKDSRVGTYGMVGLLLLFTLKHQSLAALDFKNCFLAIISAHTISRFVTSILVYTTPYVQETHKSKVDKTSTYTTSFTDVFINGIIAIIPLFFFANYWVFITILPLLVTVIGLASYFKKWIGGHTGDCAGATQQITEVLFYLSLLLIL